MQYAKELQVAAKRNDETVEKTQALAFAYNTVGISLEKMGDIGKDTNEKIGEFIADGTGGFSDFATVMGLTSAEAKILAKDFEDMSGTDVLQEMVKQMEAGGASTKEMSWALEGMASDTTDLIPLLIDGGKAVNGLTAEFNDLGVTLTQEGVNKITAVGLEFDKMTAKLSGETKEVVADYAEEITAAIRVTTEFLVTTGNVFNLIATGWGNILKVSQAAVADMVNGTDTLSGVLSERASMSKEALDKLSSDIKKGAENITKDLEVIDTAIQSGGDSPDSTADDEESPAIKKINREVEAIKDRFKTEQELLTKKLEEENAILDANMEVGDERDELKKQLAQALVDDLAAIEQKALDDQQKIRDGLANKELKAQSKLDKEKRKQLKIEGKEKDKQASKDEKMANDAMKIASIVFEDSKLVSAGIAFMNTAQGITKALAVQDYVGAALTAVMGGAQISAITGASKGGGGSVPSVSAPTQQQDFVQETTSLEVSSSGDGGSTTQDVALSTDSGDQIMDLFAELYNKGREEGRYT